jgi:HTH-like domain
MILFRPVSTPPTSGSAIQHQLSGLTACSGSAASGPCRARPSTRRVAWPTPLLPGQAIPRPPVDDASLLAAIRADLAASPFSGEGHRKVWARLHYGLGLPVGRNRVLRLMRDNQLLSPFRRPPRPADDHDGTILTEAPDVLWGTDATLVQMARGAGSAYSPPSTTSTSRSLGIM